MYRGILLFFFESSFSLGKVLSFYLLKSWPFILLLIYIVLLLSISLIFILIFITLGFTCFSCFLRKLFI